MTRKVRALRCVAALLASFALGACSGSTPSLSTGDAATPASQPPAGATFNTNADPELAAKFPGTIAGQPVTNVQTFHFAELMAAIGTPKETVDQFTASTTAVKLDPNAITLGTAQVTVGTQSQVIQALRTPGGDANRLVQPLVSVAQLRGIGATATARDIALTPANLGGKNVGIASAPDLTQYYYPSGDTVFILNNLTATDAGTILAALP